MLLTTERLILREFLDTDWQAVLAYQSDPRYLEYYPWWDRSPADVQRFVDEFIDWQEETPRTRYQLAIALPAAGRLIGNCGIRMDGPRATEADIGYELDPAHWGRGYATEAVGALLAFGFRELKLHRVWASCVAENRASARVLEKVGMRPEGRLREKCWMKGRWWDTLLYAILDREWRDASPNEGVG
jgi:[ribosomal protein S5]-alanine N-acetyltransferase